MPRINYTSSMGKKARQLDPVSTNWRENRNFSLKKESFDFEWVVDSASDRKRKGKSVDGVESSRKKSKFDFDEGFVMLSSESASVSDDERRPRWKEVISPSSLKPGPPKRGRGRPRRNKRGVSERLMKADEDVIVIDCDESDDVNNVGENNIDISVFGESGVTRDPRTGGSENSVVSKKSVSVGVQVENDQNLVIKKFVSVGIQVSKDDWEFLHHSGIAASEGHFRDELSDHDSECPCLENDGRNAQCDGDIGLNVDGITAVSEGHFCQNESVDIGLGSPCFKNHGETCLCDGLKSSARESDIGENVNGVTAASEGNFCQNESSDHGLESPCLKNDGTMGQCDLLKFDAGRNSIGSDVDAKLNNSNPFKDLEGGVISEDDAIDLTGDIEYVGEISGSYVSINEVSPCILENSKFCQATSLKDEDCSEPNTANLNCVGVARRTRSHFMTAVDRKLGTFSRPLCLSDDDDVSLVDSSTNDGAYDNGHQHNKKSSRKKFKG